MHPKRPCKTVMCYLLHYCIFLKCYTKHSMRQRHTQHSVHTVTSNHNEFINSKRILVRKTLAHWQESKSILDQLTFNWQVDCVYVSITNRMWVIFSCRSSHLTAACNQPSHPVALSCLLLFQSHFRYLSIYLSVSLHSSVTLYIHPLHAM
jgi:hypothetical protein